MSERQALPKAVPGRPRAIIKFRDSSGGKWEFMGTLPMAAVSPIIMLADTDGVRTSANIGRDEGIEAAYRSTASKAADSAAEK